MTEERVFVKNALGEKLVGLKTSNSSEKAVVLVHGFGVDKVELGMFGPLAEKLSLSGFVVYRFDFSGSGESKGDYAQVTLSKLCDELSIILEYVREQGHSKIGIVGQSWGTTTTIALAPTIDALVLMGSFYDSHALFKRRFDEYNPDGVSKRVKSDGRVILIEPGFWKDFKKYDVLAKMKEVHCPVLFIHGENDKTSLLAEAQELFSVANQPKRMVVLNGAGHSLDPKRDEMMMAVESWMEEWL